LGSEDGDWIETAKDMEECRMLVSTVMCIVSASRKATKRSQVLCFVDRASRNIYVIKTNLHYLSSVYFVSQPLHVSGIFVVHHQEVYCIYTIISTCCIDTVYVVMMGYKYARNT
jgi:hypothetical protein